MKLSIVKVSLKDAAGGTALLFQVRGESGETYWFGGFGDGALAKPEPVLRDLLDSLRLLRRRRPRAKYKVGSLMPNAPAHLPPVVGDSDA